MYKRVILVLSVLCCLSFFMHAIAESEQDVFEQGFIISASPLHVFTSTENSNLSGLADADENILLPAEYIIQETNLSYIIISDEKRGYVDKASGFYMPPQFDDVFDYFCNDADAPIFVGLEGRYWYLVRSSGIPAFPSIYYNSYNDYSEYSDGYALTTMNVADEGHEPFNTLIDLHGNEIDFPVPVMAVSGNEDGLVLLGILDQSNEHVKWTYGVGDLYGNVIIEPFYDEICDFSNGYASMMKDGKWGHIDNLGNVMIPPTYELDLEQNFGYFFDGNGLASFTVSDGSMLTIRTDGSIYESTP